MKKIQAFVALFLFVSVPFLFLNCSSEEDFVSGTHFSPHNKKFTFADFKKETGLKNFSYIKKAALNSGLQARNIESEFIIDTLEIKKYINPQDNKTTYSFKLYPISEPLGSKEYYNLVYEKLGEEWNELIFFNKEKDTLVEGESKLERSQMVYNRMNVSLSQGFSQVITYSFHCTGTGKCAGGTCDLCPLCVSETVTYVYTGINNQDPGSGTGSAPGDSGSGGGGGNYSGIYIPNPYDGEADLNNPDFILAGNVVTYINTLPNNLQALISNYNYIFPYVIDFFRNNGGVNSTNEQSVTAALTNFLAFQQNFYSPNWLTTANERIKFWGFYTFLNNSNIRGFKPQNLFDIKDYLLSAETQTAEAIINYLFENLNNSEVTGFVISFIESQNESGLNLDFEKSLKSPANIDFSAIDQNTPEGQQFTWIYSKLMESEVFKQMFTETFQVNDPRINVKFEVTNEGIPERVNGICRIQGSDGNWHNTIKIKKSIFGEHSNLAIAKTILHECIHAYLNIKKINSNLGTTIAELNGLDLGQLLGTFTGGFGGVPVANGTLTQHDFMFNYMLPVFTTVLADLKDDLILPIHIVEVEQATWYLSNDEEYNFNWPDLYFHLSLNGLHGSAPFQNEFPTDSLNFEKYYFMQELAVFSLTKTTF